MFSLFASPALELTRQTGQRKKNLNADFEMMKPEEKKLQMEEEKEKFKAFELPVLLAYTGIEIRITGLYC